MSERAFNFGFSQKRLLLELLREPDPNRRNPNLFHASGAGGCRRQQVILRAEHSALGKRIDDLGAKQRFAEGRWSHIKWQLVLHHMGLLQRAEFVVEYAPWSVMGSPDGVLVLPWLSKNTEFLLEVKGVSDYRFGRILRTGSPEKDHIFQTHSYIQALELSNILYLYENKNTQDIKIFYQKRDIRIVQELRERFKYMNRHIKEGVLPIPDCRLEPTDIMYRYCPVRDYCKQRLKEEGIYKKYVPKEAR